MVKRIRKTERILSIVIMVILMIIVSRLPSYLYGDYTKYKEPIGVYDQLIFIGGGKIGAQAYYVSREGVIKSKLEQDAKYWLIPIFISLFGVIIYHLVKLKNDDAIPEL